MNGHDIARLRAWARLRRGGLRWWLVHGPVRCGTSLLTRLVADSARWQVGDWGLHAALAGPLGTARPGFDPRRPRRALLTEVLAASGTGHGGPLDLVFKQANLRRDQFGWLVDVLGRPERTVFCLRDPAGFMASAVRKFPDMPVEQLRDVNYIGSIAEREAIGGEVFVYHPAITGADYAQFLAPLPVSERRRADIRHTGAAAPELTTPEMWAAFRSLLPGAVNAVPAGALPVEP